MEYYISLFLSMSCIYMLLVRHLGDTYQHHHHITDYRYMVYKKNANVKRRRKLHPILTLEVTLDKQINTIECVSMDIT